MKPVRVFVRVGRCWVNAASSRSVEARLIRSTDHLGHPRHCLGSTGDTKTQLPLFGQPARSTTLATKFSRRHNPACVFHQSTQALAVQGLTPQILSLYSAAATMMMRPLAPIPN